MVGILMLALRRTQKGRDRAHPKQATESAMRRFLVITAAMLAVAMSCGSSHAQSSMSPSAMGATSPLGMLGSGGSSGTGIPFGATEINPGGLSSAPNPNCGIRASGSGGYAISASGTTGTIVQSQVEALKKYRSAGEQTIKVQYVTVNDHGRWSPRESFPKYFTRAWLRY